MTQTSPNAFNGEASHHWHSRDFGECAFPVDGEGLTLRSCCRACGRAQYCDLHAKRMRRRSGLSANRYQKAVLAFVETLR